MNSMFNPAPPTIMHIDLNSCFATVEQQANPKLRGRPVVVAAYATNRGCILAASREAKRVGIKTGMHVFEGKLIYPKLIVLPPDPPKYRFINRKLLSLLQQYASDVEVKSIDEMVMNLLHAPRLAGVGAVRETMVDIGREIKKRIRNEIGDWLTVSIGIAPNRYLAKIASNLHKPDGLDSIDATNIERTLGSLTLEDLTGIKRGYGTRLRWHGICSPLALYKASEGRLKQAFASKIGYDWFLMLHGWETPFMDSHETKSVGHSFALPKPYGRDDVRLHQILCQLVEKMGRRLRQYHFFAQGIHVSCLFSDRSYWNHGELLPAPVFTSPDLYREAIRILTKAPRGMVRLLAVSCFSLVDERTEQLGLFESSDAKHRLTDALDRIADRWGEFSVFPGRMLSMEQRVLDRIAFGGVKGLEETTFRDTVHYHSP